MRIWETDKRETEIVLQVAEKTVIQKASRLLARLAKHHGGDDEKAAADAVAKVAAKWAPETEPKK